MPKRIINVTVENWCAVRSPKYFLYPRSLAVPFNIASNSIGNQARKYFSMIIMVFQMFDANMMPHLYSVK